MATHEELVLEAILKIRAEGQEQIDKVNQQFRETEEITTSKVNTAMVALGVGAAAAATAVVALAAAFAKGLSDLLGYAEGLEKANLQTGLSVEFWQKLIKTGDEMNISFDQTRGAVERMEKALEGNGEAVRKFGINVEAFTGLNADEKFRAMAIQIMAIEDPTQRTAAAIAIFGRAGAEIIPMLAAIVSGATDAQRVLGTDTVDSLNRVDKAIDGAKTSFKGLEQSVIAFVAQQLPLETFFTVMSLGFQNLAKGPQMLAAQWVGAMEFIRSGNLAVAAAAMEAYTAMGKQTQELPKLGAGALATTEAFRQLQVAMDALSRAVDAQEKADAKAEVTRKRLNAELERGRKWAVEQISKETEETRKQMEAEAKRIDAAVTGEQKLSARMATEEAKQLKAEQDKYAKMAVAAATYFDRVIAGVNRSSDTEVQAAQRVLAECVARRAELLANVEATNAQIQASNEAVASAEKRVDDETKNAKIANFELIASSASSILRSLFGKSKAAAIAAAIIDTIAAVVKTMAAYPWPWNLIPAAAAAAAGYAEVDKIRSQEAGFAVGTPGMSFLNFGPATATVLHGEEAVVTRSQGENLAAMVREALEQGNRRGNRERGGGSEVIEVHAHSYLDGREIAHSVDRRVRAGQTRYIGRRVA